MEQLRNNEHSDNINIVIKEQLTRMTDGLIADSDIVKYIGVPLKIRNAAEEVKELRGKIQEYQPKSPYVNSQNNTIKWSDLEKENNNILSMVDHGLRYYSSNGLAKETLKKQVSNCLKLLGKSLISLIENDPRSDFGQIKLISSIISVEWQREQLYDELWPANEGEK